MASLEALNAALGGHTVPKKTKKSKNKSKGKMKAGSPSTPDIMGILSATVKTVDKHTEDCANNAQQIAELKATVESIQQVVVQLGKRSLEAETAPPAKKKRKVPEHIVNYYLVATEFFSHFNPLTGAPQKKALGKAGINAWGNNKDSLVDWFKSHNLDLEANKLKIADIRTIISENDLYSQFKTDFDELCTALENATAPEEDNAAAEEDDDSDGSDGSDGSDDSDEE